MKEDPTCLIAMIPVSLLIIASIALALEGADGWGWFIVVALLIYPHKK